MQIGTIKDDGQVGYFIIKQAAGFPIWGIKPSIVANIQHICSFITISIHIPV